MNDVCTGLEPIAIIGMAGRFPQAQNISEYWKNIANKKDCITFFSDEELLFNNINEEMICNPNYVKAMGIIENYDLFDAEFFHYNPREAEIMDPQHRIFLSCCQNALDNAGFVNKKYNNLVSVFAGAISSTYFLHYLKSNRFLLDTIGEWHLAIANEKDHIATKISYKLNLSGPSVSVNTACSTSLVAVHVACRSLLTGECDMAIAGGVSVRFPQVSGYLYQEGGILSPDGHCRAFDEASQGTVMGNGVGAVVLKRLDDAIRDRDNIYAVIRSTAVNNDGAQKVGYTAPSVTGQMNVIREALEMGGVEAESIGYIEAHGTGTRLGDSIEIEALKRAYKGVKKQSCAIGTCKTNIGHLDAAAGIAGLIKTVMAIRERKLPPSLHYQRGNKEIRIEETPFYVQTELEEWKSKNGILRAGVSAFGIGGTNAHVILEEAPIRKEEPKTEAYELITISGKTVTARDKAQERLGEAIGESDNLRDVAFTQQTGRKEYERRSFVVGTSKDEVEEILRSGNKKRIKRDRGIVEEKEIVFMFTGAGEEYAGMGKDLYELGKEYRAELDACAEDLKEAGGPDIIELLYGERGKSSSRKKMEEWHPAIVGVEYALAKQLMAWGIKPNKMIGYSLGEYTAAGIGEVMSRKDMMELVWKRARIIDEEVPGSMMIVGLGCEDMEKMLEDAGEKEVEVGISESARSCVISGSKEGIERQKKALEELEIACREISVDRAMHSSLMENAAEELEKMLSGKIGQKSKIEYISNVSGKPMEETELGQYWGEHIRKRVKFEEGIESLRKEKYTYVEIGSGQGLSSILLQKGESGVSTIRHRDMEESDEKYITEAIGRIWLEGGKIDWDEYNRKKDGKKISLPGYPLEEKRYWVDKDPTEETQEKSGETRKRNKEEDWYYIPSWIRMDAARDGKKELTEKRWIIFDEGTGIGLGLEKALKETGRVIRVMPGSHYEEKENIYSIDINSQDDYDRMIRKEKETGTGEYQILHLWSVTEGEALGEEKFEEIQEYGTNSLIRLAKAMGKAHITKRTVIWAITSGIYEVTGEEEIDVEKGTIIGPIKVIPQEYLNIECRQIDIESKKRQEKEIEEIVSRLADETEQGMKALTVAYRGKYRWESRYEKIKLEKTEMEKSLKDGGIYLITGGLGYIGLTLAEAIAERVKSKIVLLGRNGLKDGDAAKKERIEKIRKTGTEVHIMKANVSNLEDMEGVASYIRNNLGQLNGVIHAAGFVSETVVADTDIEITKNHYEAKINGLYILDKILDDMPLDFCILLSSIASVLGGLGYVAYSAANNFIDIYTNKHNKKKKTQWLSINWDGGGNETGIIDSFGKFMSIKTLSQLVVSTCDLQNSIKRWVNLDNARNNYLNSLQGNIYDRPQTDNEYIEPQSIPEKIMADIWSKLLGIKDIGIDDNFFQIGGNSLLGTQMISRIRKEFEINVTLKDLFENPTIDELLTALESKIE